MNFTQQVEQLNSRMAQCSAAGDYVRARELRDQIDQLRASIKTDSSAEIQAEHEAYKIAIDEAYAEEQRGFNADWERRLDEFNQAAAQKMEQIKLEHEEKLQELDKKFEPKPIRFSASVIQLRDQEAKLAKNARYEEAKVVQRRADEMEQRELRDHTANQQIAKESQKLEIMRFYEKQAKSLAAKMNAGRADILQKWAAEMDKLEKHHEAMMKAEMVRYQQARNPRDSLDRSQKPDLSYLKKQTMSPVATYIRQEGPMVDGSKLGASMGPVASKSCGLKGLK